MSDPVDVSGELNPESAPGLVSLIQGRQKEAEDGRQVHEERWLKAYKNFRGIYDSTTQYTSTEKSKVFIKITKTKVLAAYGQIVDILFANKKFPLTVEPTPVPEGIAEFAHLSTPLDEALPTDPYGYAGDGRELPPGAMEATGGLDYLGGLAPEFKGAPITEGPSKMGEPQLSPAQETARRMEKVIHDQLTGTNATTTLRNSIFESVLLGTGIIKGPFTFSKTVHKWDKTDSGKEYTPYTRDIPKIEAVSCWDLYTDPMATNMEDCDYVIQRHKMNRTQLHNLIDMPMFDPEAINEVLAGGGNYADKYFESIIRDDTHSDRSASERFEILEYWGCVDSSFMDEIGMEAPENDNLSQVQVNIWICGGQILRAVANPFTPMRIPYQIFPYEISPYQIWGIGIPENMEDAQMLMNGHVRMAIDNLSLAGNMVFDVDETSLVPGQNYDIFPGKIFRRQSGVTGTAINGIKFPNTANENIQMYDKARQLADEETGIPSIMHGQTGVTGTGRTAAGLSMLLGSAGLSIKTVIKNIDDHLLKPIGEAFFQWNMQFNIESPDIEGDLEIKPKGVASVMQKEVRSQRLIGLLQTVANPMLAPFIKIPNLIKELAISQDIDPDSLVNDMNQAQIYAEMLKGMQPDAQQGQQQPESGGPQGPSSNSGQPTSMGASQQPAQGTQPTDLTGSGNGTIGVGGVPAAGESQFAGNAPQLEE
tara:strand:- start:1079 stop:3196 length:2118 start_codon:yes stop_codon:yes gene_type:complete